MYTAFNLRVSFEDDFLNYAELVALGQQRQKQMQTDVKSELERFTSASGTIDGTGLSDEWFEKVRSDVFISHSHNDEDLAFALAGWLKCTFNLDVFLDESVWGSADELLRALDDKHCWQPQSETYNYKRRNLTTSHVHAMLSTAIYSVMDKTEVVLFLNTDESIPPIDVTLKENSEYTLSPWIYQELMATKLLRKRDWTEYRLAPMMEHAQYRKDSDVLKIAYKTPLSELTAINGDTLCRWAGRYLGRPSQPYGHPLTGIADHPLNHLYETVFEEEGVRMW